MSRLRTIGKLFTIGIGPAACVGVSFVRNMPVRLDAPDSAAPASKRLQQHNSPPHRQLSPQIVEQLSRGSILGFGAGVLISLFSRTLVFLGGLVAGSLQIASRMGIDVFGVIPINRKILSGSPILRIWMGQPWFTSSFLLTFILAAFIRL